MIAVIGDGAMSAGMAYEAMNNAGVDGCAADRDPERQRHVDRAAGGGDERLSVAAVVVEAVPVAAASGARRWRSGSRGRWSRRRGGRRNMRGAS